MFFQPNPNLPCLVLHRSHHSDSLLIWSYCATSIPKIHQNPNLTYSDPARISMTITTDAAPPPQFHTSPNFTSPAADADVTTTTTVTERTHDGLYFWQYMIAGSVAGCVEHMAMFPVDTIKTRMQALGSCPIKTPGLRAAFSSILRNEGPAGFYRGIAAMGLGAGPAHAVYFSVYEACKKGFSNRSNVNDHVGHAAAGVCATVTSDAVFTPMDMVKQRLQLNGGGAGGAYGGVWDCVKRVWREEGVRAFYASYRTTVIMNAPFTAVHFATYEATKKALLGGSVEREDVGGEGIVHAAAGAVAGASAALVTTPLDVVKTQLQCQGVCGCDRYTTGSISGVLRTIVKKDGYRGLVRGWMPRMLFHAPAAAICWSTYEAGKSFFQKQNESEGESLG